MVAKETQHTLQGIGIFYSGRRRVWSTHALHECIARGQDIAEEKVTTTKVKNKV